MLKSKRVGKIYLVGNRIGQGTFGEVYSGINLVTKEKVAIKAEPISANTNLVPHETNMYRTLQGGPGVPKLYYSGAEQGYNIIVMDILGPSLQDLIELHRPCLSLPTVLRLSTTLIGVFNHIHDHGILHRDVKPDNILLKHTASGGYELYLIDYGVSKRIIKNEKYVEHPSRLVGTARYQSITSHKGGVQSKRDDLESLGYVLVYLARGKLHWQGQEGKTRQQKNNLILEKKLRTPLSEICEGLPAEFQTYLQYCRQMSFEDRPDYEYLKGLFVSAMKRLDIGADYRYDWDEMKPLIAEFVRARDAGGGMRPVKRIDSSESSGVCGVCGVGGVRLGVGAGVSVCVSAKAGNNNSRILGCSSGCGGSTVAVDVGEGVGPRRVDAVHYK